jgi:hypothetical protein
MGSAWLHFKIHYYTHFGVHSHVFTSRCSVAASNVGRPTSSGFPNYPRPQLTASHSNSSQRLNLRSSLTQWMTNSVTHQPTNSTQLTLTNSPAYSISARTAQKTLFLCCRLRPLHGNCSCLIVSRSLPSNRSTCHNRNIFNLFHVNHQAYFPPQQS